MDLVISRPPAISASVEGKMGKETGISLSCGLLSWGSADYFAHVGSHARDAVVSIRSWFVSLRNTLSNGEKISSAEEVVNGL